MVYGIARIYVVAAVAGIAAACCAANGEERINRNTLRHVFFDDCGVVDLTNSAGANVSMLFSSRGFFETNGLRVAVLGAPARGDVTCRSRWGLMTVNGHPSFSRKLGAHWDQRFFSMKEGDDAPLPKFVNCAAVFCGGYDAPVPARLRARELREKTGGVWPPADWQAYRDFVADWSCRHPSLAGRLLSPINEPDYRWKGTDEELVRMYRIFSQEVKRRYPDVKVLGPMDSRMHIEYMKRMIKAGLFAVLDGVTMHAYSGGTPPEAEFYTNAVNVVQLLDDAGYGRMPIHVCEFGWSTGTGWQTPVDEATQAKYLTRSMALLSTLRFESVTWFCDLFHHPDSCERGFSLLKCGHVPGELTPTPALVAYRTWTRQMGDVVAVTRLNCRSGKWCVTGVGPGRRVSIVWSTDGEVEIGVPDGVAEIEDHFGRQLPLTSSICLTDAPVYFIFRDVLE